MMKDKLVIDIDNINLLNSAAGQILSFAGDERIIAFEGEMGSGKTTLIKAICSKMGVADNVSSPTFAIINEYFTAGGDTIYHFDFYRLKNLREAMDIGVEEYLDSGSYCFLEWPELVGSLLPEDYIIVTIEKGEMPEKRTITVTKASF